MYGGLRGSLDLSMLGSRAERGAVGRMERSMGGALYESSSVCHDVETGGINILMISASVPVVLVLSLYNKVSQYKKVFFMLSIIKVLLIHRRETTTKLFCEYLSWTVIYI